jgi:arylsulfatase A-like enzyme
MKIPLWLTTFALGLISLSPASAAERKPNVIVFLGDDTGYTDPSCYGSKDLQTPNVDSLAKNGVRCTSGYVSCPYCSPTRAGLLTGRYQQRFGHEFNEGQGRLTFGLPLTETTFAQRMKELGYATAAIGKWHLGNQPDYRPMKRGFDEFYGTLGNSPFRNPMLVDSRVGPDPKRVDDNDYYTTDAYADRAIDIIEKNKDKPFFLYFPFNANHVPVQPPPQKYLDRVKGIENMNRRLYAAMFAAMDDAIGRVLAKLRDLKLEENTLIFFLCDNGGPMTKMGPNGSNNAPLKGQKGDTWEGAIRVPWIVQWKGKLPEGKVYDAPVISLDILPTSIVAAGGKVSSDWKLDGVDLLSYLTATAKGDPHDMLYWRFGTQWAIRQGDWKLVQGYDYDAEQPTGQPQLTKVVSKPRLHNLADDIGEKTDLAEKHPDKVKSLQAAWNAWNKELPEPGWLPQPPKKKKDKK